VLAFGGSVWIQSLFVCLWVESFQSTLLFIGDNCCSYTLVMWGLSTMTPPTVYYKVARGSNGGPIMATRLRLAPVLIVVVRGSTNMVVTFVTSGVLCTAMADDE
jgi:hypothetical protein